MAGSFQPIESAKLLGNPQSVDAGEAMFLRQESNLLINQGSGEREGGKRPKQSL